jgi:aspartyl aminopeptidase
MQIKHPDFFSFLTRSVTVYHAAEEVARLCREKGFILLHEKDAWDLKPKQGYVVMRGDALVAAFQMPEKKIESSCILATHLDSPCLKIKPKAEKVQHGIGTLNVETYGAPLLHTWFDRELVIAGMVAFVGKDGKVHSQTVSFEKTPVMIPSLAIHLDRTLNEKGFLPQKQDHLRAVFSLETKEGSFEKFLQTSLKAKELLSFDLFLVSPDQPFSFGLAQEFVAAPRLDNLTSAYAAVSAITSVKPMAHTLQMALFFDHEEIGSVSAQGADSVFASELLQRIAIASDLKAEDVYRMKSRSLCLSGDVAHAMHPNFLEKYDVQNAPVLGGGIVFKFNANQKYATSCQVSSSVMATAQKHKIPIQTFASRSDIPSGSTIGSMLAAATGIATIDVGICSLAMHSICETIAAVDEEHLSHFFEQMLRQER